MMRSIKGKNRSNISRILFWLLVLLVIGLIVIILIRPLPGRRISTIPDIPDIYLTYEVVNVFPHDTEAFTQGLVFVDGYLYESTGLYGESTLRKVALETGEVLQQVELDDQYFAEGLTYWENKLILLTWREGTGFVYYLEDFSLLEQFSYESEGWGLTHYENALVMSDGSENLTFLNPETYQAVASIAVHFLGESIPRLNELETIHGKIYANIWQTDDIVRIEPDSGRVTAWIDMSGLLPDSLRNENTDVLNGIAYDSENDRLFVTGKRWPKLYEIRLVPKEDEK